MEPAPSRDDPPAETEAPTLPRRPRLQRRPVRWLAALALFTLALGLRVAYIQQSRDAPGFRTVQPGLDIDLHWQAAKELRAGGGDGPRFALMMPSAPLFPALLAGSQSLLGEDRTTHRYPLAVLGALTVVLLFFTVWWVTGRDAAPLISGLVAATYPATVYFDSRLIKVAPELLLLTGLIALLFHLRRARTPSRRHLVLGALGVGLLLSGLLASQLNTLLYGGVAIAYLWRTPPAPGRLRWLLLGLVAAPLLVTGVALTHLRGLLGADHPVFVPQAGIHLRVGFHDGANGTYHRLPGIPGFPLGHTLIARLEAEQQTGRRLSFAEADRHYRNAALAFVRDRPQATVALVARKLQLFFNHHEPKGNEYLPDLRRRTPLLAWLPMGWGLLWIAAPWGALALWGIGRHRWVWLLAGVAGSVLLANLASFVTWRYRIHAVVPLFLLVGPGVVGLFDAARRAWAARSSRLALGRFALRWLLPAALVGGLAFSPLPTETLRRMARATRSNHRHVADAEAWQRALAALPSPGRATAAQQRQRAVLLHRLARYTEAFRILRRLAAQPAPPRAAAYLYLTYLAWLHRPAEARRFLARHGRGPVTRHPDPPTRRWLARISGRQSGPSGARSPARR